MWVIVFSRFLIKLLDEKGRKCNRLSFIFIVTRKLDNICLVYKYLHYITICNTSIRISYMFIEYLSVAEEYLNRLFVFSLNIIWYTP